MSEPAFPGDPLTRAERAALIQRNLQKPQVNHHPTCCCGRCKARRDGATLIDETQTPEVHA